MQRLKILSMRRFYIFFWGISFLIAGITLLLALELSPWLYAVNARVELHLQASAATKINICWDKTQIECLPLIPYLSEEKRIADTNEIADVWLTELPPRPSYTLSLLFKSKMRKGILHNLEVNSQGILLWGFIPKAGVQDIKLKPSEFSIKNITYTVDDGLYSFEAKPGGCLTAVREIEPGPPGRNNLTNALLIWGLLLSFYCFFAIPIYFLPFVIQNRDGIVGSSSQVHYPWWVYTCCGVVLFAFLFFALYSPLAFYLSDQLVYLNIALRQDWFIYPARPPGYYMFVALLLWLFDNHLEVIVLTQAIILAFSTVLCIWALKRWLHPLIVIPLVCGILFSPSQINWTLSILRESIFVSLILLGVTAVISHFTTQNKLAARIWLAVFAIVCALALCVRENGIILPGILLPALLPEVLKRLKSSDSIWKRLQSIFSLFVRYAAPIVCAGIVYLGFSFYNYLNYGYFQFTLHVTSHHFLWQEISTANFDPRALLEANDSMDEEAKTYLGQRLYRSFIEANEETPPLDPIYASLLPTVNQNIEKKGRAVNFFYSASILDKIGKNASILIPWKANLMGMIRQYRSFFLSDASGNYNLFPDDPAGLANKLQLLAPMSSVRSVSKPEIVSKPIKYQGRPIEPDSIIAKYYDATHAYTWYRPLFFLALLFGIYLLRYHDPVFLVPLILFIANGLLLVLLRGVFPRFIECLDVLLVLQIALGLSRLIYTHGLILRQKFFVRSGGVVE